MNTSLKIVKGTGRRKSAVAQVQLVSGTGEFLINNQPGTKYMQENPEYILSMQAPLELLGLQKDFNTVINVQGGGLVAQANAIKLGIARALCNLDTNYRSSLKAKGYLTRDARSKERKKYGLKKARKAPQFSKR
uniref:Small ribosomal subunit protein uS9c n=2 Tax=Ignatiaceae TaxID=2682551 RepID=A0A1W6EGU5_9CHLO|nr:ribosomal protein S9 [Pseudocharacium americanum]YP_009367735.1 ribosomal protein S9 [Ignatius tetrasporus]ARK14616.1 ribosomal protein S9 [Pseudocharacium americanum]ARK14705.1 ribosomal protein S9 [Ignatius tetrasporus]